MLLILDGVQVETIYKHARSFKLEDFIYCQVFLIQRMSHSQLIATMDISNPCTVRI